MKFAAVLSSATVAAAAAISKRDVTFSVSDFGASCIPHSTQCSIGFTVIQPGTMETTGVECKTLVTGNTDGTIPDVKDASCTNSSRTFDLPVSPHSNQTGSHLLPSSDFKISNEPNAVVESYTGPGAFDLE
ncbi:uncharacterized protein ColSpa_09142 [Colletotrichum spaethianum]|uniref:Hypersensitive response-inducing protein n=1 Tax=Colletotrichum spaethianum TaxID=700344 RepID=A0AA37UJW5_9PEZI|nr:uncharacterized protein ColSpa_09142 [Colletotrichum spaethianum]GKT48961.1 hypothetical protein ColSpa_09142 [Colletotrichum spaethianum]